MAVSVPRDVPRIFIPLHLTGIEKCYKVHKGESAASLDSELSRAFCPCTRKQPHFNYSPFIQD